MDNKYIKITKLPDKLNENNIKFDKMYRMSCKCPYCDSGSNRYYVDEWYGTEENKFNIFNLFKEKHYWKKFKWSCSDCGAKWESMPFRWDYPDDVIYEEVNINE